MYNAKMFPERLTLTVNVDGEQVIVSEVVIDGDAITKNEDGYSEIIGTVEGYTGAK